MIRTSYYSVEPKGGRVELHLRDGNSKTIAILDVSLSAWQQMERWIPPKVPPMDIAADHAVVMGTSLW